MILLQIPDRQSFELDLITTTTHESYRLVPLCKEQVQITHNAPILDQSQPTFLSIFQSFWSQGIPIVVSKCLGRITVTDVGREFFMRCYGHHRVRLVDCRGIERDKKVSLAGFLSHFGQPRSPGNTIWKLKVVARFLCFRCQATQLINPPLGLAPIGRLGDSPTRTSRPDRTRRSGSRHRKSRRGSQLCCSLRLEC